MIFQSITRIRQIIAESAKLDVQTKSELTHLLDHLKEEVDQLSRSEGKNEETQQLVICTEQLVKNAIAESPEKNKIASSQHHLKELLTKIEVSHPKIFDIVNQISFMFSRIGI